MREPGGGGMGVVHLGRDTPFASPLERHEVASADRVLEVHEELKRKLAAAR